ncbi:MAG: phosphoribosylformylglycinamidine cyclo-ligase [Ignavibacteriales bacterium]|nr:phosphoribosylformylglycinamidine cyclo-ligase [Ignavibacteriales bacterium]MBI3786891.1 phosphoribosylformylglycinamidine cyclo-ligase [Ignavibacteriales bacterium]
MAKTYKDAGVDIEAGEALIRRIKKDARSTFHRNVLADIGSFGAFYRADFKGLKKPVLVTSVDGVGTKLKIAFAMNRHDTVGQDLVNHCVNDILVCGAKPLYFLDYFATGKLSPSVAAQVISGFVKACKENGCSLVGGETAEMPGFYSIGEYDLAGTIVGVVEETKIVNGHGLKNGDILIGLPSTGLHTNGYSLARSVLLERYSLDTYFEELKMSLGDSLLTIHRSYFKTIYPMLSKFNIKAMSHITGGGIVGNTMRVVPKKLKLKIDWGAWKRPAIFEIIQKAGKVPEEDMRRALNLGVGLILMVAPSFVDRIIAALKQKRERPFVMGEIANA